MRLAVCALSAVLMSGCSWMGTGNNSSSSFGYGGGSACSAGYGAAQQGGYGYGQSSYGYTGGGCGMAGGYGQGAGAYGMAGGYGQGAGAYGQGAGAYGAGANGYGLGYGAGAGYGQGAGAYGQGAGANGYGAGAGAYGAGAGTGVAGGYGVGAGGLRGGYGAGGYGTGTVLGGTAPYGAAVGGAQYASSGQYVNGQWIAGGTNTFQTVQGSPIYVPQPYPAYYGVGYNAGYAGYRGASAALPFGLEFGVGTEFGIGGNIVDAKPAGVATGGTLNVSATPAISYKDAYKKAVTYDAAMTYDISPSTTILGRVGYSKADGNRIKTGTIDDGTTTEDLYAQWGDLEEISVEGGVRQYVGGWNNGLSGFRPYVGASAGFTHNNDVSLSQDSATLLPAGSNVQPYLDSGWSPTASGVVGAEMQVGPRTAIGIESGIRWRDDINSNVLDQEDRWSIPVKLRGRVSF